MQKTLAFSLLLLAGCGSVPVERLEPEIYYERDLSLKVNDRRAVGHMVADRDIKYEIEVRASKDQDYVILKTCSRYVKIEDEGSKFKYFYVPMDEIENRADCPMQIYSLNKEGQHGWAFLAFADPKYKLYGYLRCNGEEGLVKSVATCQAKANLIQSITFQQEVDLSPDEKCDRFETKDNKQFMFKIAPRECVTLFRARETGEEMLLYTIGFEEAVLRK